MAVRKQVLGEGAFPTCGWETAVKERGSMAIREQVLDRRFFSWVVDLTYQEGTELISNRF